MAFSLRAWTRTFWHPPRPHDDDDGPARVTPLELFYDLVFVVVIAALAHGLEAHPDAGGVTAFGVLFVPVWWVWIGGTFYNERFETYDLSFRVFTFLQMAAVLAMAVTVEQGLGARASAFALSYVAARVVITFLWWRAGQHNPRARPATNVFVAGFSLSIALWTASAFVDGPLSLCLKGLGLVVDLVTPALTLRRQRAAFSVAARKLPERFGLFVLIVLGESIVGVANGLAGAEITGGAALRGTLGLLVGFGLWWVYFDFIGRRTPDGTDARKRLFWTYLHLPASQPSARWWSTPSARRPCTPNRASRGFWPAASPSPTPRWPGGGDARAGAAPRRAHRGQQRPQPRRGGDRARAAALPPAPRRATRMARGAAPLQRRLRPGAVVQERGRGRKPRVALRVEYAAERCRPALPLLRLPAAVNADPNSALYTWVIIGTIVGFALLAAVLLVPVSRFITREMRRGERWNDEIAARRDAGPEPPTPDAT